MKIDDFIKTGSRQAYGKLKKGWGFTQYEPGWGELSSALGGTCSWDSFYERTDEVMAACCESEAACPGGMPTSCSVECGEVYVPY